MITLYKKIERCLFKGVSSLFARCSSLLLIFQTSDMILTSVGLSHYTLGRATMELSDVPHTVRGCDSQHNWGCVIDPFLLVFSIDVGDILKQQQLNRIVWEGHVYVTVLTKTLKTLISIKRFQNTFLPLSKIV